MILYFNNSSNNCFQIYYMFQFFQFKSMSAANNLTSVMNMNVHSFVRHQYKVSQGFYSVSVVQRPVFQNLTIDIEFIR